MARLALHDFGPALGWALFGLVHSALASRSGTALLQRAFDGFHRIVYNLVAVLMLLPLLVLGWRVHEQPFFRWQGPLVALQVALLACALVLFFAGARHYRMGPLLGWEQLRQPTAGGAGRGGRLDSRGVLGLVRHPWYTGVVLLVWAGDLDVPRLAANLVITAYVVVGTLLEERKLGAEFGDVYRAYQARVSMFVPYLWLRARLRRA